MQLMAATTDNTGKLNNIGKFQSVHSNGNWLDYQQSCFNY